MAAPLAFKTYNNLKPTQDLCKASYKVELKILTYRQKYLGTLLIYLLGLINIKYTSVKGNTAKYKKYVEELLQFKTQVLAKGKYFINKFNKYDYFTQGCGAV